MEGEPGPLSGDRSCMCWTWLCSPVTAALGRQLQEDYALLSENLSHKGKTLSERLKTNEKQAQEAGEVHAGFLTLRSSDFGSCAGESSGEPTQFQTYYHL